MEILNYIPHLSTFLVWLAKKEDIITNGKKDYTSILWDMFTGSRGYGNILNRINIKFIMHIISLILRPLKI